MGKYCIRPIPLFKWTWDRSQWTYRTGLGEKADTACFLWYIEGSNPRILVDAGATAEMFYRRYQIGEHIQSPEEGLAKAGLKTKDVDIVILTHLHWDHVALAAQFTKAKFIVQKAEVDFANHPHPAVAHGYDKTFFKGLNFEIIEGDREIIKGIKVLLTPGHTPGGQSIAVETEKGLNVITGFCCTLWNFNPPVEVKAKGLPVIAPTMHTDLLQVYDSTVKVKEIAERIIPLHEGEFIKTVKIP